MRRGDVPVRACHCLRLLKLCSSPSRAQGHPRISDRCRLLAHFVARDCQSLQVLCCGSCLIKDCPFRGLFWTAGYVDGRPGCSSVHLPLPVMLGCGLQPQAGTIQKQ